MSARPPRPPGRNASCPCGSGKKYKVCCITHSRVDAAQKVTSLDDDMQALAIAGGIVQRMITERGGVPAAPLLRQ